MSKVRTTTLRLIAFSSLVSSVVAQSFKPGLVTHNVKQQKQASTPGTAPCAAKPESDRSYGDGSAYYDGDSVGKRKFFIKRECNRLRNCTAVHHYSSFDCDGLPLPHPVPSLA